MSNQFLYANYETTLRFACVTCSRSDIVICVRLKDYSICLPYLPIPVIDRAGCEKLGTTLNGVDFKFVSCGLWSEKQNIILQHMHKKEFWIFTNKCGNNF